jgi:HEAT repeat protein
MNCQEVNQLLDADDFETLSRLQRDSVGSHLASCAACSEDWANLREISALPVPATPVALRGRIAAALHARKVMPRHRPFVVGSLLLVGLAAAAAVAVKLAQQEQENVTEAVVLSEEPAVAAIPDSAPGPVAPAEAPLPSKTEVSEVTTARLSLDPHAIVVLLRPEAAADDREIATAAKCRDAAVRHLRAVPGLNVIADAAVFRYEGNEQKRLPAGPGGKYTLQPMDQQIARKLGAGNVLVIRTENGCAAMQFATESGEFVTGLMAGNTMTDAYVDTLAASLARNIRDKTLQTPAAISSEARSVVLDESASERSRVMALEKLYSSNCPGKLRCVLDKEVIAAASTLGSRSTDASTRGSVWAMMRNVDDPVLVQPLLTALASDPHATVRMQAALTLHTFLDRPGVREALLRAAEQDPSKDAEMVCCVITVREAAQRAAIADKDYEAWVYKTVMDQNLPARSRLMDVQMSMPDGRVVSLANFGKEAAMAVFDIGRFDTNPRLRQMAWNALRFAKPDDSYVQVLVSDVTSHPDEYVRYAAAQVLTRYTANSEARAALVRARDDSSSWVRQVALDATEKAGN